MQRQGVPSNLEQRLQHAWIHSQIKTCKHGDNSDCQLGHNGGHTCGSGGGGLPPQSFVPARTTADLSLQLEQLWGSTQLPANATATLQQTRRSNVTQSATTSSTSPSNSSSSRTALRGVSPSNSATSEPRLVSHQVNSLAQALAASNPLDPSLTAGFPAQQHLQPQQFGSGLTGACPRVSPSASPANSAGSSPSAPLRSVHHASARTKEPDSLAELTQEQWLRRIQLAEPVQLGAQFMEEDFFRGLDELTSAFDEMEHLLPADLHLHLPTGTEVPFPHHAMATAGHGLTGQSCGVVGGVAHGGGGGGRIPAVDVSGSQNLPHPNADLFQQLQQQQQQHHIEQQVLLQAQQQQQQQQEHEMQMNAQGGAQGPAANFQQSVNRSQVISMLMDTAKAIVASDHPKIHSLIRQLTAVACVYGDATQRVSSYFLEGLLAKASGTPIHPINASSLGLGSTAAEESIYKSIDCDAPLLRAFEVLVSSSPFLTFGHVACNSALLEASRGARRLHIVDFGIGHAVQWPPFIQALSVLPGGPPHLRITGIDRPYVAGINKAYCLRQAGQRLKSVAATFKVPFSFNVLPVDLPDLNVDMVKREEGELLLVNCSLRLHNLMDETVTPSNPRAAVLKTMRQLQPALATLVEQHTNHNSPFFLSRFLESLHYYALLFDAMDASVADSEERRLFERRVLGRAIVNVVAAEGQERTERQEPLGHWQRRVQRAGFAAWPLSRDVVATAGALLSTYKGPYSLSSDIPNSLVLNYKEQPLLAMSAWRPC